MQFREEFMSTRKEPRPYRRLYIPDEEEGQKDRCS